MKLLHVGDLHLGRSLGDFDLIADQEYILDQILGIIDKYSVDAILIAGDVWDRAVPSEAATRLLDSFLTSLSNKGVKTYMISGNHDSDDRLNYANAFFESRQVYIASVFDGSLKKYEADNDVCVWLLPFVKASQVRHFYEDAKIETYEDAVRTVLEHTEIDKDKCNILVAHQFVAENETDPVPGGSEGAGTLNVGTVEKIGYDCFDDFDYVALGHIHSPQSVGRKEVRYSGSPLKYSLSEVNNSKSVPIITVDKKDVNIELVPLKPMRDMRHICGKLEELLDKGNIKSPEDFIYATLTDEDVINDAMGIIQQTYPYTVKIDYDNSHTREIEQVDIAGIAQNRSFTDLIGDFYRQVYGCEISDEELTYMVMVAREAGVEVETD